MWQYNRTEELYHHGVLGMKWGVRRYQNKDGTLTPLGQKKAQKALDKYQSITGKKIQIKQTNTTTNKKKSVKDMTNEELDAAIRRKEKENRYKQLYPETVSKGKKFMDSFKNDVLFPGIREASKEGVKKMTLSIIDSISDNKIKVPKSNNKSTTSSTKTKTTKNPSVIKNDLGTITINTKKKK